MQDEPGDVEARGTGVVCFLYKDGYVSCPLLRFSFSACMHSMIAFREATVRMYMFAR
jgi:hypothetical protein